MSRWICGDGFDEVVESEGDSGLEAVELPEVGLVLLPVSVVGALAMRGGLECVLAVAGLEDAAFNVEGGPMELVVGSEVAAGAFG